MSTNDPTIRHIRALSATVSAKTTWILVAVEAMDGVVGYGEATRYGSERAILTEIAKAAELLAGQGIATPNAAAQRLAQQQGSDARAGVGTAIEQALVDGAARRAEVPFADLLGGAARAKVPVYANINRGISDRTPTGFAARAAEVVAAGYTAVKIAPFDQLHWARQDRRDAATALAAGIARIQAVRQAIGPGADLMVDCHNRLSPILAAEVLRAVGDQLYWLEDPLSDGIDAAAARSVRGQAHARGVRIAGGERLRTLTDTQTLLDRGEVDIILPDLRYTGVRRGLAMLDLAVGSGVAASLHNPAGPVLDRISLQVAAAAPSFLILERQVAESPLFDAIGGAPAVLDAGALRLPAGPGFGPAPILSELREGLAEGATEPASLAGIPGAGPDA